LQIPKELRAQLGLQRYVRLEVVDGGIMIRAVDDTAEHQDVKSHFNEMSNTPSERGWRAWLKKWGLR
jgi:bifunctional DNA-binding transcriptional regulator/antitoxin component of YhaV-PrlF toxin-antitoxin module